MSDGTIRKPDKDYQKEVDKLIPETQALAKVNTSIFNRAI
jgi:26S proteasome regulatory subunit N5